MKKTLFAVQKSSNKKSRMLMIIRSKGPHSGHMAAIPPSFSLIHEGMTQRSQAGYMEGMSPCYENTQKILPEDTKLFGLDVYRINS